MAEAETSTTLFHPHVPNLTRERSGKADIDAHVEAGWLLEDPQLAEQKKAEEEAEAARRSEAARKGAETRRKNAENGNADPTLSDGPAVAVVSETPQ